MLAMMIAFTGHRDRQITTDELEQIAAAHPGATWVHGGARGFDSQVETYARARGIPTVVIRPDYKKLGKPAPLILNRKIVDMADALYACYDGRQTGGTLYTLRYAQKRGKPVHILSPVEYQETA